METLEQRASSQHFPLELLAQAVNFATSGDPAFCRAVAEPADSPRSFTAQEVAKVLATAEREGKLPEASRWPSQAEVAAAAQAAQEARAEAQRAYLEARAKQDAADRAEREEKYRRQTVERANLGIKLTELRAQSGLTSEQMSVFLGGVDRSLLSRLETGHATGARDIQAIVEGYELAARFAQAKKGDK